MMTSFMATTASSSVFFAVAAYGDQFQPLDAISDGRLRIPESACSDARRIERYERFDDHKGMFDTHHELSRLNSCGICVPMPVE